MTNTTKIHTKIALFFSKLRLILLIANIILLVTFLVILIGFNHLNEILQTPLVTSSQYLETHPWILIETSRFSFIWSEPSSTILVYGLGVLTISLGIALIRKNKQNEIPSTNSPSKSSQTTKFVKIWGIALIIWGIGTMLAGTSYQAFFYELKCKDQIYCLWTTWWEIAYLALTVISVNLMVVAQSYLRASNKTRLIMIIYAELNLLVYFGILSSGMLLINSFLLSFEMMVVFQVSSFIILFIQNIRENKNTKAVIDLSLMKVWIFLAIVMAVYFGFYYSGIPEKLWSLGIWFNANDILHVGLMGWMIYIYINLKNRIIL